jgi:hypothetical protein
VQVDDLVDQRGTGIEDHRDQGRKATARLQVAQVLGRHLSAFAGELEQAVLVNGVFQATRQRQVADGLQPFQVGQHMLGLRRAGRLA